MIREISDPAAIFVSQVFVLKNKAEDETGKLLSVSGIDVPNALIIAQAECLHQSRWRFNMIGQTVGNIQQDLQVFVGKSDSVPETITNRDSLLCGVAIVTLKTSATQNIGHCRASSGMGDA